MGYFLSLNALLCRIMLSLASEVFMAVCFLFFKNKLDPLHPLIHYRATEGTCAQDPITQAAA